MTGPQVFDRKRITANKDKAALQHGAENRAQVSYHETRQNNKHSAEKPGADFLLRHAAAELASRLPLIKRRFERAVVLGAYHGVLAELLVRQEAASWVLNLEECSDMLAHAAEPKVKASNELLPIAHASAGLICSALSLHLVNDLPGVLIQCRRALQPDGLFLCAILGGNTLVELRQAFLLAETELTGGASPRVFPNIGWQDAGNLLQRAGFSLPVVDSETLNAVYASPYAVMNELKAMGAGNALVARHKGFMRRDVLRRAAGIYEERFSAADGKVRCTFEILYLSGWAPHDSQQKPLRPGSAKASLAKAL